MRNPLAHHALLFAAALACVALTNVPARAQSTAFTYQGSLDDGGAPAGGLHDFRFRLFSVVSGGVQIGSTLCVDNVSVIEGVFTAQLDFGQQFATTAQRFLEIEVRRDTGLNCANAAGFFVMGPRQQITSTPMASHANSAFALDAADGSPTNAVFVDNEGKVGIGTTSPATQLHVNGAFPGMTLQDTASPSNQAGYIEFRDNALTLTGWLGYGTPGSPEFSVVNARTGGDLRLYTGSGGDINFTPGPGGDINLVGGNVGVGTYTPAAKLDVRGDIRLGPTGQLRATSSEENLRIIRGVVDTHPFDGCSAIPTIDAGSGFSIVREACGRYRITFTTPFAGMPAVTTAGSLNPGACATWVTASQISSSGVTIGVQCFSDSPEGAVWPFSFIAIGPR